MFFLLSLAVVAQEDTGKRQDWRELYERLYTEDGAEETDEISEEAIEHLTFIAEHPYNINTITQEQLEQLPFLSSEEINAIGYYIYRYGEMMTLQELQAIPQLSADKRLLLRHFLYCGSKEKASSLSLKNILKYAQHNIYYGARIPLYERRGDVLPASEGGYLGFPLKHQFRYTLSYGNNFRLGIVGANDAGEEFFAHKNALGYDYYSFFMQLKERRLSQNIMLDNLVIGKYIGGFGMGLVINNGFSLGKSTMMASAGRISTGFRPHASTTDGNYFQGLATTIGNVSKPNHAKHKASVFASYRFINANRSGDSITTILTSGYHRTENELLKKNTATATTLGANYQFGIKRIVVGATAAYTHLNRTLMPDKRQA
ncbi:MAG: helix-hairpin-helix domain-containing protein, partial [Prevotella sp.]|nr:helix-hairpin-helix domain-containing protein [Prevotella sp.]